MTQGNHRPRVEQWAHASGFAKIFQAAGNMTVYEAEAPYQLNVFSPPDPTALQVGAILPSRLLHASHEVVPFTGRTRELAELRRWREDPAHPRAAVRLVHGPGGQGKTRLATQAAREWADEGWLVLQARHRSDRSGEQAVDIPDPKQAAGVLVVVDYAERWAVADLLTLLRDTTVDVGMRVRVLLLARPAGTWWDALAAALEDERGLTSDQPLALEPLATDPRDREVLFTAARDRFADLLGIPDAARIPPPGILHRHDAYTLVLTVHMAALAAVLAHAEDATAPPDPAQLSSFLLRRERRHWRSLQDPRDRDIPAIPTNAMGQAVYAATLTGPLPWPQALAVAGRAGIETREHPGHVLKAHAVAYPAGPDQWLAPLYPDRLGEDYLALTTPGHSVPGHTPDPWAEHAVSRILLPDPLDTVPVPADSSRAMAVLIETAHRWPHIATAVLAPLVEQRPQLVLHAGGAALASLAAINHLDISVLEAVERHLPEGRHVELDAGIAAFVQRLTRHRLAHTTAPPRTSRTPPRPRGTPQLRRAP